MDSIEVRSKELLETLNDIWGTLPPVHLAEFNNCFYASGAGSHQLNILQAENSKLMFKSMPNSKDVLMVSVLSLLATITDILIDRRLAAQIDDNYIIVGWQWYKPISDNNGQVLICLKLLTMHQYKTRQGKAIL